MKSQPIASISGRHRSRTVFVALWIAVGWLGLIGMLAAGAHYGVTVRKWAWDQTPEVRFVGDIQNGYSQGRRVCEAMDRLAEAGHHPPGWRDFFSAYLDNYAYVVDHSTDGKYGLDYTPTRLLVMSLWVKHLRELNPPVMEWNDDYAVSAPLLHFNAVCEAVSAVAMILLVRHWRRARFNRPIWPAWRHPWREWPAVLAGLAVWFNPALILDTHAWPQWDVWLVPFFLLGVLAASKDKWLLAGFIVMIGATLKGQVLMIFPVLLLWPLLSGRPLAALRLIIGAALLSAIAVLPWMAYTVTAQVWLICMLLTSIGTALIFGWRRKFDVVGIVTAVVAAIVIACVMVRPIHWVMYVLGGALLVLTIVLPRWLSRAWMLRGMLLQLSIAIFAAGLAFGGQFQWFEIGYVYPQHHYPMMSPSADNLARLLADSAFHWQLTDTVTVPFLPAMPMRSFLITLFSISLALCGIGAAMHARQRSPRLLIALAAPWVLLFSLMPQMHERYLVWGAVMVCAGVGISPGQALLAMAISVLSFNNMAMNMLSHNRDWWPAAISLIQGMSPGAAWGLLTLAAVYLYLAVTPDSKRPLAELNDVDPLPADSSWDEIERQEAIAEPALG